MPDWVSWLRLLCTPGLGPVSIGKLIAAFGDPATACDASAAQWQSLGLDRLRAQLLTADAPSVTQAHDWLSSDPRHHLLNLLDPDYPPLLKAIDNPPAALFVVGARGLLCAPQLGVVGARTATPQGLDNARQFSAELARRGVVITSGLALGIDGAAHQGALDQKGGTIAVCGTGLDRVYPARHKHLAHAILAEGGVLISEYLPGTPAKTENFPRRNRIIAGLSLGILVVEASPQSGSLITAKLGADQGREIFAIPGSIHNPLARGCHALIRQGAKLVENVDDIFIELQPKLHEWVNVQAATQPASPTPAVTTNPESQRVLQALGEEILGIDDLVRLTGLPAAQVHQCLLMLELDGHVGSSVSGFQRRHP